MYQDTSIKTQEYGKSCQSNNSEKPVQNNC